MKNQNKNEELFRRYLDGELNSEEEMEALRMIAEDEEMRELLRFERTLFQTFSGEPDPESFDVPDRFTDSVMSKIAESGAPSPSKKKKPVLNLLFQKKEVSFRPVYAAAAVILLAMGFSFLMQPAEEEPVFADAGDPGVSAQVVSETESNIWIRFVYFDEEAESIEVAGDFSGWEPVSLSRELAGDRQVWTGLVPIPRGEHRYMFIKDGEQWVTDPLAEVLQDDGFGNKNAVLYL